MRNQTDMMREILTNETAQRIINFVSPIYGNSYVGLWIYQAIGVILGEICDIAEQMQYETTPATAELLLDFWEDHYDIPRDSSLTSEQRRQRILSKIQSRPPCTPVRMAAAISSVLSGIPVEITENVAKNTFFVTINGSASDLAPAFRVIDNMKPAHLIYRMKGEIEEEPYDLKVASAVTHAEAHVLEPDCVFYETVDTSLIHASALTLAENRVFEVLCSFYETLEAWLAPASAITHAENFTVEVF